MSSNARQAAIESIAEFKLEPGKIDYIKNPIGAVFGEHVFSAIDASMSHTCAIDTDGQAWAA